MTTNCRRAAKHITAYVDGQLAPRHRAAMERHLARCEECSRRVAEERATKSLVRRVHVAVAAPERLRQQINIMIARESMARAAARDGAQPLPRINPAGA